jgi:hypothetical protein
MTTFVVDLSQVSGPVYSGRDRGEALRVKYGLDSKEDDADVIDVVIPTSAYTVSSSFFLGLLGPSVRKCGSVDLFERKFRFSAPEFLKPVLHGHAQLALQNRKLFG